MKFNEAAEGRGFEGIGESLRQQTGWGYTTTGEFLRNWNKDYKGMSFEDFKKQWEMEQAKYENNPLPDASSPELE
ncbi:MAG: hypothetical protein LBH43_06470 [Treponema sp.]|jgi:hypothetical protein|nr:hypothetical protein [Treponema sp.]